MLCRVHSTGRHLSVGSYGSVVEVKVDGVVCADKQLHPALLEQRNGGVDDITCRFLPECQVTSITATDFRWYMVLPLTNFEEKYLI